MLLTVEDQPEAVELEIVRDGEGPGRVLDRLQTLKRRGGDSHLMTPGRGIGANTALRDAELLTRKLTEAHHGKEIVQAISEYEREMVEYGFEAVLASREQMDGNGALHKPVIGRVVLAFMRTFLRVTNAVPALKRRMLAQDAARRDHVNSAHEVVHAG